MGVHFLDLFKEPVLVSVLFFFFFCFSYCPLIYFNSNFIIFFLLFALGLACWIDIFDTTLEQVRTSTISSLGVITICSAPGRGWGAMGEAV